MRATRLRRHWLIVVATTTAILTGCGTSEAVDAGSGTVAPIQSDSTEINESDDQTGDAPSSTVRQSDTDQASADTDDEAESGGTKQAEGSSIPLEEWQERLETACAIASDEILGVDPFDEIAWSNAVISSLEVRVDEMKRLPLPTGFETEVEELLTYFDTVLAVHAESGPTAAVADLIEADSETSRMEELVVELGIEDCGQPEVDPTFCDRVPAELVASTLGGAAEPEFRDQLGAQGCQWEVGDNRVAVQTGPISVYAQAIDYFRGEGQAVDDIGTEAFLVGGFSSVTGGSTRGSTLWVLIDEDVHGVAAEVDGGAIDSSTLLAIATELLAEQ